MTFRALLSGAAVLAAVSVILAGEAKAFATYWAVVNGAGAVSRSSGVTGAVRNSAGVYEVTFSRNVNTCVFSATPRSLTANLIAAITKPAVNNVVIVSVFSEAGVAEDRPFNLTVVCNP